jgi:ArsR family transcriptional regulator
MAGTLNTVFKAIADPTRREILHLLRKEEMSAGALAAHFDMTKPTLSHHFAVLKDAGLVTSRREAQTIWYALNTTVLEDVLAWTMDMARGAKDDKGDK